MKSEKIKASESATKRYHLDLVRLIDAWREVRKADGQIFAGFASDTEMSKDFVKHYWRMVELTKIGRQMRICYKNNRK